MIEKTIENIRQIKEEILEQFNQRIDIMFLIKAFNEYSKEDINKSLVNFLSIALDRLEDTIIREHSKFIKFLIKQKNFTFNFKGEKWQQNKNLSVNA